MAISREKLLEAATRISECPGLAMDPHDLVDDVFLLSEIWSEEGEFEHVVNATCYAIGQLVSRKVTPGFLKYGYQGWLSYHYQAHREQGAKAVCRIVFKFNENGIDCVGFGHRHEPAEIYHRLKGRLERESEDQIGN